VAASPAYAKQFGVLLQLLATTAGAAAVEIRPATHSLPQAAAVQVCLILI